MSVQIQLIDLYMGSVERIGAPEFLYALMKEREPEINISHSELPSWDKHLTFIRSRPYRCWYLIEQQIDTPEDARAAGGYIAPVWCGYVSATDRNEIGIVLAKAHRGRGIGPAAVQALIAQHEPLSAEPGKRSGHWLANIAPSNEHSKHVFQKLGFAKIQETYARPGGGDR